MTNKNVLLAQTAAAITTLAEVPGAPESILYIGVCDSDIHAWHTLRAVLLKTGFVTISANYVTITDLGRTMAAKIEAITNKGKHHV